MIRKLLIRDFQRHRRLEIRLDPRVTTLVGSSDSGKSAVARALRWVCQNRPKGSDFVRDGAKTASVRISVGKHRIERKKGFSKNQYILDGKVFAAFGHDVPEEISRILRLDDVNFQSQLDPPFWFSLPPAEVSRRLNKVVDLSLIDSTLANLSRDLRRALSERKIVDDRLREIEKETSGLREVKEIDRDLRRVEGLQKKLDILEGKSEDLGRLLERAEEAQGVLSTLGSSLERGEKLLEVAEKRGKIYEKLEEKERDLFSLLQKADQLSRTLQEAREERKDLEKELSSQMGDSCALCGQSLPR